ncbi:MAG: signal peptide peptidase SppA [Candidatus Desulfofervidus sp.]|nr:signal peptide peptidase SppA [Candidatus Desulfofervidus sp.]
MDQQKKHPILSFLFKLSIFAFIFLLGFGLAKRYFEKEGIGGKNIGVIEIKGIIKTSQFNLEQLVKFRKNNQIKAVLLRIDSPGGAVVPSQELYMEILKLRQQKPVVASLGNVAASGGYYIASAANKIVAAPGTLTGSIGVKIEFANIEQLLKKLGIQPTVIKSVPYKDIGSPVREMTKEEKTMLEKLVKNIHSQFVKDIAKGRNMPIKQVESIANGSIFTGQEAKKLGLVDQLGNFEDAIRLAAKLGKIKEEPRLLYPKKKSPWMKLLTESLFETLSEYIQQTKIIY